MGGGETKPWQDIYPQVYQHTMCEPAAFAVPADALATAWLLTGERAYADKAKALLLNLASYSFVVEHYDVGMNCAIWTLPALKAYDALLPELAAIDRERLDAMFTRAARAIAANDAYWIENSIGGGLNNHLAWHKMMLGLFGLFYERPGLVEFCLHGLRGLVPLLEEGLVDDGLWCESSLVYHFTAIVPMAIFADCQRRTGESPAFFDLTLANGRRLKQAFDAAFDVLAPDGLIPPVGDAVRVSLEALGQRYLRIRMDCLGRPEVRMVAVQSEAAFTQVALVATAAEESAGPAGPFDPPARARLRFPPFARGRRRSGTIPPPAARSSRSTAAACTRMPTSSASCSSGRGGCCCLMWRARPPSRTPSAAASSESSNRGGLSQNTVMIDGRDQRGTSRPLRLVEYRDLPEEKRITVVDDEGLLYEGVRQMRTVCLTPDYVLDVFQVGCGAEDRQIDWIAHVIDETATVPPEHNSLLATLEHDSSIDSFADMVVAAVLTLDF